MLKHRPWSYAWHCSNRSIAAAVVKVLHLACHFGHNGGENGHYYHPHVRSAGAAHKTGRSSTAQHHVLRGSQRPVLPAPVAFLCRRQTIEVLVAPLCTFFGWVSWIYFDATCMWVEIPVKPEVLRGRWKWAAAQALPLGHGMSLECGWWPVDDGWVYLLHFWVPLWNISSNHGGNGW